MEMRYCMQCGEKLVLRDHPHEGRPIPYCESCGEYRYPVFSTAVSMIVTDPAEERLLLIRQYGRPFYILTAGYVDRGEDAETAARRELREELGAEAAALTFNHSRYFPPSNTLMLNFTARLRSAELSPNWEIDDWAWFTKGEAAERVKPGSLAEAFLRRYLGLPWTWPEM